MNWGAIIEQQPEILELLKQSTEVLESDDTLSAVQLIKIYETRLDELLEEVAELRRYKAIAVDMIECLSHEGAVRV